MLLMGMEAYLMRVYEIALIVLLVAVFFVAIAAWMRRRPRCPKCRARTGQETTSEREVWSRNLMFSDADWFASRDYRLKVRRQTLLSTVVKCSRCGHAYETTSYVVRDVL